MDFKSQWLGPQRRILVFRLVRILLARRGNVSFVWGVLQENLKEDH